MNRLRALILSIIVIFLLVASYFLYRKYFVSVRSQDIILSEDHEEHKKKPADPGGIVIPNSNSLIYEKLNPGSTVESQTNLQSEPEQPIDLAFKTSTSNKEESGDYDSIDDILAKLDLEGDEENLQTSRVEIEPITVEANAGKDEMAGNELANEQEHQENLEVTEEQQPNRKSSSLNIIKLEDRSNKLSILNKNSIDSSYKVHLSSSWSEKEAELEWKKIQGRHLKYLGKSQLIIKKVKAKNGKIIYLVMAGNYSSLNQAKLICKKLHLSKQNCIVTK